MAKTLQTSLAAVLMSTAVALAVPAYAASKAASTKESATAATVGLSKTSTKAAGLKGKKLASVEATEKRITAELNKQAVSGQTGLQSSIAPDASNQQAAAESEPENSIQ